MRQHRLLELDALRGLAALVVVFYHYLFKYNQLFGHPTLMVEWSYLGKFGVELFFMISGFVIYWTLNRVEKPFDFLVSRVSRLYPVYWAAVIVSFSVVTFLGLPGREVSLLVAIGNMMMFHEYFRIPHVDGVYWTLTVELTFYFWIFIAYLFNQLEKVELWLSLLVLLSILQGCGVVDVPVVLSKIFILSYVSFFVAGICFFKIQDGVQNKYTWPVLGFSLLSTVVNFSSGLFFLFLFFYVVFFMAISGHLKFLAFKPFIFFGSISYSLYLIHQNIGYAIIYKSYALGFLPFYSIMLSLFFSVFVAFLLTKFVEKPALIFIRDAYKNSEKIQYIARRLKRPQMGL